MQYRFLRSENFKAQSLNFETKEWDLFLKIEDNFLSFFFLFFSIADAHNE